MHIQPKIKKRKISKTEIGFVLVAKPFWNDENYKKAVILIVEHTPERAVGLIINKQSNLTVNVAINELPLNDVLHFGGPFNKNLIIFLHSQPQIEDCIYMGNDLYIGGDYEDLKNRIKDRSLDLKKIRFLAGCVQWSPGQLEQEIQQDKWWVSETGPEYFNIKYDHLWKELLDKDGHLFGIFNEESDFSLN